MVDKGDARRLDEARAVKERTCSNAIDDVSIVRLHVAAQDVLAGSENPVESLIL